MRTLPIVVFLIVLGPFRLSGQHEKHWDKVRHQFDKGRFYAGIRSCDKMLSNKHRDSTFLVLRAEGNNRIAEYERAMRDARNAMDHVQGELRNGAALQLGVAMLYMGFTDSARYWLNASLGAKDDSDALYRLGVLDRIAGNCGTAITSFDKVIKLHPDRSEAFRERGGCRAELGDTTEARHDLDRAIILAPRDPVAWNSRGYDLHARSGRWMEAIEDYDQAIKLDPNYSFAFNNRGWAYYRSGDTEKAIRDISLAGRKKRTNPYVFRNLGVIALESGDTTKACNHFKRALDMNFTVMHGPEVEDLIRMNCRAVTPPPAAPNDTPKPVQQQPGNAPTRENAPERGNAP